MKRDQTFVLCSIKFLPANCGLWPPPHADGKIEIKNLRTERLCAAEGVVR